MTTLKPPAGFVETPAPAVAEPGRLVSHVEEIVVDRPLDHTVAFSERVALGDWVDGSGALPGVVGTLVLAGGTFDRPGSRHMVFLSDGTTVLEQVLEKTRTSVSYRFRYVVWGYTTKAAEPLRYGVGDFLYMAEGDDRTRIRWTYSFALKPDRFPGVLGVGLGGFLLKLAFLNGPYAAWMRGGLARLKAGAEAA